MPRTKIEEPKVYQPSPKVLAARENGRKGGLARARNNSAKQIKEWGAKGGRKTADTHSHSFMSWITTRRKHVGRNRKEVVQLTKLAKKTARRNREPKTQTA